MLVMDELRFDRSRWPRAATQRHWSVITGISNDTLRKSRERGMLPAKKFKTGLTVVYKIAREDFEKWFDTHYKHTLRGSLIE